MMAGIAFAVVLAFAPFLFLGIINRVKARWAGRCGAPLLQPLYDTIKLLRKGEVVSTTSSAVFQWAPTVSLAAALTVTLLVPLPGFGSILSFSGDFILFAYLLGFSRFVLVIAAFDTGSSFEVMGASRDVTLATLIEPGFFIISGTLALATGHTSFADIFGGEAAGSVLAPVVHVLSIAAFLLMLVSEGARVPVDDPNTHLELTMIHEVMILETSGPDLAFLQYAVGLKMVTIGVLISNLIVPAAWRSADGILGRIPMLSIAFVAASIGLLALVVGAVESLSARARLSHVPQLLFVMVALALAAFGVVSFFARGVL